MQSNLPPTAGRNPLTQAAHRREVLWQIAVPFILGVIVIIGLAVALGLLGVGDVSSWSEISLMWLLLPMIVLALIPLAVLVASIYGLARLVAVLPAFMHRLQQVFSQIQHGVRRVADRAVEPGLRIGSTAAALRALRREAKSALRLGRS